MLVKDLLKQYPNTGFDMMTPIGYMLTEMQTQEAETEQMMEKGVTMC